jgi:NAD(P)-dependent dehydrogenase (short-subunit alcohol dehydrogenase family)
MKRLSGKVAAVTGGASGIGEATVRRFVAEGAKVAFADRDVDRGKRLAAELGASVLFVESHMEREAEAAAFVRQAADRFGRLDILVNNAGWTKRTPHPDLEALTDEIWQKTLNTNLMGAWYCIKHAVPVMQRQGHGVVINITSVAAFHGMGSSMAYCASKAALSTLTRSLARAVGPTIRVNALAPGLVDTGFVDWPPEVYEEGRRAVSTADLPAPEDLGEAALFLAAEAKATTGTTIFVDGGIIPLGPRSYRPSQTRA